MKMDGLSAAASGIAVVSLALQLVDSVREIRRFLRSVLDAPNEFQRLLDLLEQLELILQQIVMLVEKQQNRRFGEPDVFRNILRVIKTCEIKLAILERLVEGTKQAPSTVNRAARIIGSLKLAWKKKDIQGFESQLYDSTNLLTLAMMANLTYIHSESTEQLLTQVSATNQAADTITQELVLIHTVLASDRRGNCSETRDISRDCPQRRGQSRRSTLLRNQSTTIQEYTGPFGELFVRRISRSASFGNEVGQSSFGAYTVDESSWVYMPSFLSSRIDFRYLSTCGKIQRSIKTYPVIPKDHPVWEMCKKGNLQGIQKLLSERQVSPFGVDTEGNTLLHYAAMRYKSDVCKLLFEVGLTGGEVNTNGSPPHQPDESLRISIILSEPTLQNFKRTCHLFASRLDDLNSASFAGGAFSDLTILRRFQPTVHLFTKMVNEFVSKENINDFRASPIHMAMWMLWESHPTDRDHDSWKQVTRRLISMRPDHHDYSNHQGFTLLDEILNLVERPFESISIGREFLDILSDLKVELLTYLQVESKRHFDPCKPLHMLRGHEATAFRERYLVISETPPSVSWEWFIDPEGSAFDVLDEFKNFTLDLYPDEDEKEHWPIAYSNCCKYTRKWQFGEALSPKELSKLRMYNDRFQRCQYKKALKLDKAQGILRRSYKVPGAWID